MRYGIGLSIACLLLYTLAMFGVRAYAHSIGLIGGSITIAAIFVAAYWHDPRQERKHVQIWPPESIGDQEHWWGATTYRSSSVRSGDPPKFVIPASSPALVY